MKQHKLVLFDIDGTLMHSVSPILRNRFNHAIEKVHGKTALVAWEKHDGSVDKAIIVETMREIGIPEDQIVAKLSEVFEAAYDFFVGAVDRDQYANAILPGAKELLIKLEGKIHLGILTGNYDKIAWAKLDFIGLKPYFEFGVFGHEADDRDSLAKLIHEKAQQQFGKKFNDEDIFIIGDTPRDISCARVIHAKSIAVATGKPTREQLQGHRPDLLVENLNDPQLVKFILGKTKKAA